MLDPGLLSNEHQIHAEYLQSNLAGSVLIVGQSESRLKRLRTIAKDTREVVEVEKRLNDTSSKQEIDDHDLSIAKGGFDTILYSKERTSWFGRQPDFFRVVRGLSSGGTLIVKTPWVPDSRDLSLEEIAIAGGHCFEGPEVYMKYNKAQTTLADTFGTDTASETTRVTDGGVREQCPGQIGEWTADAWKEQIPALSTQFGYDNESDEYSPGWSWHSELKRHVRHQINDVDGQVVNLCCGTNDMGDLRIDQLRKYETDDGTAATAATMQADAARVPLQDNSVGGVITDPPWKVPTDLRIRIFSEAHRIVRPGGRIIHNSWWIPEHPYAELVDVRATVANVTEDAIGEAGGLSFLATFEVAPCLDLGERTYTLADHYENYGEAPAEIDWNGCRFAPAEHPMQDPRIVGPHSNGECSQCGCSDLFPRNDTAPIYECGECEYRNTPRESLDSNPSSNQPNSHTGTATLDDFEA